MSIYLFAKILVKVYTIPPRIRGRAEVGGVARGGAQPEAEPLLLLCNGPAGQTDGGARSSHIPRSQVGPRIRGDLRGGLEVLS